MKIPEQTRHALKLRQEGLSFRRIGRELGVSAERARTIVRKHEARLNAHKDPLARTLAELGRQADATRIMNALRFAGLYQGDPAALAARPPADLARIAHLGPKSLALIAAALYHLGHPENPAWHK